MSSSPPARSSCQRRQAHLRWRSGRWAACAVSYRWSAITSSSIARRSRAGAWWSCCRRARSTVARLKSLRRRRSTACDRRPQARAHGSSSSSPTRSARALGVVAALAVIALVTSLWITLLHAPVVLAFEPLGEATRSLADDASPQRARYDSTADKLQLLGPCFDDQREPLVVGGETLVLRVSARDGLPYASALRAPRLFIASVSRAADPVILRS